MSLRRVALPYTLAGGLAALVDLSAFHGLSQVVPGVLRPAVLSFAAAAVVNYLLSSCWVFRRDWRSPRRALKFMLFACVGLAVNAGTTWAVASSLALPATAAKAVGIGVAFGANFLMNAWLVFGLREAALSPRPGEACAAAAPAGDPAGAAASPAAAPRRGPSARE